MDCIFAYQPVYLQMDQSIYKWTGIIYELSKIHASTTTKDLNKRKDLFTRELSTILADSPKYQALLKLLQGSWPMDPAKTRSKMTPEDKLVVISNFLRCAWLIAQV